MERKPVWHKPLVIAWMLACAGAWAEPGVLFDVGGKADKTFNELAYRGISRWGKEARKAYLEMEVEAESDREEVLRQLAQKGANPVISVSHEQFDAIETVALEFPRSNFVIIDDYLDLPNVQSILFKEHEGSFLVGALAAIVSKTGVVGFIGGMDIPVSRNFQCGYEQGAKFVNPKIKVLGRMAGMTGAAWNNPSKGAVMARELFSQNVDVVFAAAGDTGLGVYQAASESGKLAIGSGSNQNYLYPGTMLTTMLKRLDIAVYEVAKHFRPGLTEFGLKENGVDYAVDSHNAKFITPEIKKKLDHIKESIIKGEIAVVNYMDNNNCKY